VTEAEIAATIAMLAAEEQMVVEGSGAAAAAAVLHGRISFLPTPAAIVVSGGNIDPARHEAVVRAGAAWAG
jgi:threonine dehydratase